MDIINYLWFIPSIFMLLIAIFVSLEAFSKKNYKDRGKSYYKQSFFLLLTAIVALLIDKYFLASFLKGLNLGDQIANVLRFLFYPAILYITSIILGEKKEEKITLESIRKRRSNK